MYKTDKLKSCNDDSRNLQHLVQHGAPPDALRQELIEETKQVSDLAIMQIANDCISWTQKLS